MQYTGRGLLPAIWRLHDTWLGPTADWLYAQWPALGRNESCLPAIVVTGWSLSLLLAAALFAAVALGVPGTAHAQAGKITVGVTHEGSNTVIRIADEGAGLSPEDLVRLFGRFQRLSAKPTAGESSTGLGLSIVKRIIDMHGGHVTAESSGPGQGSTFTVTLPATETS